MVPKINRKAFHHSSFFFINNKINGKKLYAETNSLSSQLHIVVHKYKNLLLHINFKLAPFAPNLPVHSLSLISISFGILWSSKIHVAKFFENS